MTGPGDGSGRDGALLGLVPAAGSARRLGLLPCSKEIYPLAWERRAGGGGGRRPRVACDDLLAAFRAAGVRRTLVVVGHGKWDIPAFLGDGADRGLDLGYLTIRGSPDVPHTVARSRGFLGEAVVAFGFPDIVFRPEDAFRHLHARYRTAACDLVLGLFPARAPEKVDMVETGPAGEVQRLEIKPRETTLSQTWLLALWGPEFTRFLSAFVADVDAGRSPPAPDRELYLGDVVQAAVESGLRVCGVGLEGADYLDIGTPDELDKAVRRLTGENPSGRDPDAPSPPPGSDPAGTPRGPGTAARR